MGKRYVVERALRVLLESTPVTVEFLAFKTNYSKNWIQEFADTGALSEVENDEFRPFFKSLSDALQGFDITEPQESSKAIVTEFNQWKRGTHPLQILPVQKSSAKKLREPETPKEIPTSATAEDISADALKMQRLLDSKKITFRDLVRAMGKTVDPEDLIRAQSFGFGSPKCDEYLTKSGRRLPHWSQEAHKRLEEIRLRVETASLNS